MEFRFFALFLLLPFFIHAQGPKVPARLEFADMKLRIMEDARREIQEDVNTLTRSPTYFNKQVEKAKSYFPIIERVFREEKLPDDFKFLVLQESGLISDAVSSSNAVGFWQFKDFTALEVGLRVDRQIDERMNIVAASRGAARYLKKNNNSFFDNWLMSLQAYQMGPGTALKVGADKYRGQKTMTINKKTYWYVKKYIAHKIAYQDAVSGKPLLALLEHKATPGESLSEIATLYRVDNEEVKRYNKWLKKGKIPDDKGYTVIVPTENADRVAVNNTEVNTKAVISTISYDLADPSGFPKIDNKKDAEKGELVEINGLPGVLAGLEDTPADIANMGNVDLSKFLKYNDLTANEALLKGQVYYLKSKRGKAKARYHVAKEGESLWSISQKYAVKLKKLRVKNRMGLKEELKPGRVIWLRYIRPAKVPVEYREVNKKDPQNIENGEEVITLSDDTEPSPIIADSVEADVPGQRPDRPLTFLEKLDSLEQLEKVKVDTVVTKISAKDIKSLEVAVTKTEPQVVSTDSTLHTHAVAAGETYYAISKKYQVNVLDLLEWNNLSINDKLSIGQKIKVYLRPKRDHLINDLQVVNDKNEDSSYIDYVVKEGDTLYSIARENEVKVEDLLDWNEKTSPDIKLGEVLKVKKPTSN